MKVIFVKAQHRRYLVRIERDTAPPLWTFGPGYDDHLPHDLLHFVAEAELSLDGAIFGDLAAGGNARMFKPFEQAAVAKMWRRARMHKTTLPDGRRSERAAGLLETAWQARRARRPLPGDWQEQLAAAGVDAETVEALMPKLDALAARWHALPPDGELALEWPRPEGRNRHAHRQRRRRAKTAR